MQFDGKPKPALTIHKMFFVVCVKEGHCWTAIEVANGLASHPILNGRRKHLQGDLFPLKKGLIPDREPPCVMMLNLIKEN